MHNIPQPDKRCSMFGIKGSFKKQALLFHIHKIQAVSGTKGLDFHRTFVFLERNSLSRVSFGQPTLLKGHYLWPLHAGISLKKQEDNSGRQPRSERKEVTAHFHCSPSSLLHLVLLFSHLQVGFLQKAITVQSQIFQKDMSQEFQGQI